MLVTAQAHQQIHSTIISSCLPGLAAHLLQFTSALFPSLPSAILVPLTDMRFGVISYAYLYIETHLHDLEANPNLLPTLLVQLHQKWMCCIWEGDGLGGFRGERGSMLPPSPNQSLQTCASKICSASPRRERGCRGCMKGG